ncbi:uncharacterized protein LOC129956921 isoform X2 [Argiope bruennichi]|uniref:Dolichol phosphate-mannose biosynthesis regulatory protein n=1 Tax=Argiope bruennichi TaxID=94029 RepID=A0A8T0FE45_ARGBR|nr:uncharacterized protein LOC129956921 isoform X2 [Argiope bruennichi]KAF8788665.1 hypothetical protein HNY73_006682 [Argiope bruennichi]
MSAKIGCFMIAAGVIIFIALSLKILIQPFIPEDNFIHDYFPATELVFGIPILFGVMFFCGFGMYIFEVILKENVASMQNTIIILKEKKHS